MAHTRTPSTRIAAELRRRIEAGELRPGDRVPSTRAITAQWGVAMATATKALGALRDAGLVRAVRGVGTVVVDRSAARPAPAPVDVPSLHPARPEAELTRERIVLAAVAIADEHGMGAVSMRRIAARLDVAAMTLYRHLPGKEDLVAAMADAVFGRDPVPPPARIGWRARLEASSRMQWAMYHRHPWLAHTMSMTRPLPTPRGMAHVEWAIGEFEGVEPELLLHIAVTMLNYVRGTAIDIAAESEAERSTGVSNEEWMRTREPMIKAILHTGDFPMYTAALSGPDVELSLDSLFTFGLERLLDGIAVLIADRG